MFEYVAEDVFGGDGVAEDVGEVGDAEAEVFGYEVATEVLVHGGDGTLYVLRGDVEDLLVALVGDYYRVCGCLTCGSGGYVGEGFL